MDIVCRTKIGFEFCRSSGADIGWGPHHTEGIRSGWILRAGPRSASKSADQGNGCLSTEPRRSPHVMNCAFILSPSFSGSTLLSILLTHHPKLTTLGEFLDSRERKFRDGEGDCCSCGSNLEMCPYLNDLTRDLNEQGMQFSINYPDLAFRCLHPIAGPLLRASVRPNWFECIRSAAISVVPAARREVRRIIDRNLTAISTILRKDGASVYLDSAKNNNRVLFFQRYASDMSVKVIWLKRDGRGVCNSHMNHNGVSMEKAIQWWSVAQYNLANTLKHLPPENTLSLFYEDLCNDPHAKLGEVCRFLGLDMTLMPDEFHADGLHLTGNNMRLRGLSEIREDRKWRTSLTEVDLEVFERRGSELNRRLGYTD